MDEYIEREALCKACGESIVKCNLCVAKEIPAADVVEVVHGQWIVKNGHIVCNKCEALMAVCPNHDAQLEELEFFRKDEKYCYNCGARMDGDI